MALPEMYRHSKKHEYFGTKLFLAYMVEATAQVRYGPFEALHVF